MFYRFILAAVLLAPIALLTDAKPTKPPTPPKTVAPAPKLPVETNWGTVTQNGYKFTISGDPDWSAEGEIKDGKAYVLWTDLRFDLPAPSIYQVVVVEGTVTMHGLWGYLDGVKVDRQQGTIIGDLSADSIYSTEQPGPDI